MRKRTKLQAITLLLVLACFLFACEDGYKATVKSIKFYYEGAALDIYGDPIFDDNDVLVTALYEIEQPYILQGTSKKLYIQCEVPSSITGITVTAVPDLAALVEENTPTLLGCVLTLSPLVPTGTHTINVTAEPGGITAICLVERE